MTRKSVARAQKTSATSVWCAGGLPWITAARAALETSLSVSEADEMLSELAKDGHVEVRAREGRLGYALWEHDRKELTG